VDESDTSDGSVAGSDIEADDVQEEDEPALEKDYP
jgi:hypothetical protein